MSENSTNTNSVPEPAPRRRNWRLLLEIALGLAVIALGALLLFRPGEAAPAPTETPEPTPEPVATPEPTPQPLTLCLHGPEEDSLVLLSPGDFYRAPEAPLEGYTFLRWQNADGEAFPAAGAQVWEETDLYPVYAMRLGRADHAPYLSLDEQGAFHPGNPLSRREVVSALYFLLDTELVGDGSFLDLPEDDPLAPAAATLKQLGVLSGSRLHPDETITRQEFLAMLCCFFPEGTEPAEFSDLTEQDALYPLFRTAAERGWIESGPDTPARPDDELSRLEFVSILSEAMDRHGDREKRRELVGTILDLRHDDPHFWDVAEAVIPHKASGEGAEERWIRSKALPLREEGLFFLGTELHAIDSEGNPVVNGEYAGLLFDKNGVETSGSEELDRRVRELLPKLVDPSSMEGEQMLRVFFDYLYETFRYRSGDLYPLGETGWEVRDALELLEQRKGNCYNFAALYCELARAVGYDARAFAGAVFSSGESFVTEYKDCYGNPMNLPRRHCPHGWVEIEIDGVTYVFDPVFVLRSPNVENKKLVFFKMDPDAQIRFGYLHSLDELPESDAP